MYFEVGVSLPNLDEQYQLDKENLKSLQKCIGARLDDKLDKLYNDFLDIHEEDLGIDDVYWINKIFRYIKQNM